ncbi:hypothetical protein JCM10908_006765 [Rhodotorula pacifica]|uniref:M28 family metallopeptidase n=1 Tax=Rhodotorula pacifica TaxID=1495444 RepID=UPI00317DF585
MASEKVTLPSLGGGDVKEPLLPAPTPSSSPPRPTSSHRLLKIALACLALGSLYLQYGPSINGLGRAHWHGKGGQHDNVAAYARRLGRVDDSLFSHSHPHAHGNRPPRPLSYKDIQDTLLSVPTPESAKAASKSFTGKAHVAGTPQDRNVALSIKSQWEEALGATADPEHKNVFDAGTKQSREALLGHHGHGHGRRGCPHKGKKHEHHRHKDGKRGEHGRHRPEHEHHHHHGHHHDKQDRSLAGKLVYKLRRTARSCADRLGLARSRHHNKFDSHHHHRRPSHDGHGHGPEHRGRAPPPPPPHHHEHGRPHGPRQAKPRVWTDTYYSLLNYPVHSALSLTAPGAAEPSWRAKLKEDVFPEDSTSGEGVGIWHGFSKNGTVKGQLVYASRGTKEDFEMLAQQGVDVKGKIVAVQYGGSFRGLKVKAAAEAGAVGVVIFTDPIEDGDVIESPSSGYAAYPAGPARAPSSVQRGSVQYLSLYPGDPLTPGQPSYNPSLPNAPDRLPRDGEEINIPSIPSIPLSYEDAIPLLKSLNGKGFKLEDERDGKPKGWKEGGLRDRGVEYWTGPGEEEVELTNVVDEKVTPIWNTYAIIPGQTDEVVILGNHHDAWTFGAGDPNSGTASVHETVRAFGALLEKGWKPLRTIMLAAWDAEEFGLIGSTEFGEDFADWLQRHVVAYLNVDVSVSGSVYDLAASPSLSDLLKDVSAQVPDPDREGKSLADPKAGEGEEKLKVLDVAALGSGSDFTVFLQRLGLASANFGMRRGRKDPVYHYHSNFDSFHWQSTYGDPTYERHVAISRVLGLTAARLADDLVLPINITAYAVKIESYLDKVAADPLASRIDLSSLRSLSHKILSASQRLAARAEKLTTTTTTSDPRPRPDRRGAFKRAHELQRINKALKEFEKGFLGDEEGLQGREWYRHLGVAPGRWLGYGATTLPGLAEALALDKDVARAEIEVKRLEKVFKTILRTVEHGFKH